MSGTHDADLLFAGSVPQLYDEHLVPLIFEEYADDLGARLRTVDPTTVLEVICPRTASCQAGRW